MSFLTTQPDELFAAANALGAIGSAMETQNIAAAARITTEVIPAAADEVSALQASLFTAYGTLYQQVTTQAQAMYGMLVNTLQISAGSYAATESANSAAAAAPGSGSSGVTDVLSGQLPSWMSGLANIVNVGAGNWASAASDLFGVARGGVPAAAAAEIAGASLTAAELDPAGVGVAAPMGAGAASSMGAMTTPSWVGSATPGSSPTPLSGGGASAPVRPAGLPATVPGMPGLASATRTGSGFGAPRYGIKPAVIPKPAVG